MTDVSRLQELFGSSVSSSILGTSRKRESISDRLGVGQGAGQREDKYRNGNVASKTEAESSEAETAALAEIDREAKILSSWDSNSEFSKWFRTQGQPVHVSPELFQVLDLFDEWRTRTGGAMGKAPGYKSSRPCLPAGRRLHNQRRIVAR
jgi:hypothetical protein